MNSYSNIIIENFLNPKNVGEISDADAIGEAGNPDNGNYMKIWINIDINSIICDIKFKTVGCVPAIAAGSIITQLAYKQTIQKAFMIDLITLVKEMGGIPTDKLHTAQLAIEALNNTLKKVQT